MRRRWRALAVAAGIPALVAAGVLGAVGLAGATGRTTPLDGRWRGAILVQIAGSLEGGFTVSAAEPTSFLGCQVATGRQLGRYARKGGSTYLLTYLNVISSTTQGKEGVTCDYETLGPRTVQVTLAGNSLSVFGCGDACWASGSTFTRVGPGPKPTTRPPTTTTKAKPPPPKPKPKPKPKPPPPDVGWLELNVVLMPAGTKSNRQFKICLTRVGGGTTLCYRVLWFQRFLVRNHGRRLDLPVGTKVRVCPDFRHRGWITPACRTRTIGKGLNRVRLVIRRDTSPPVVKAWPKGTTYKRDKQKLLLFDVKDDSGSALVHFSLYDGGKLLGKSSGGRKFPATGKKRQRTAFRIPGPARGPLFYCIWAEDAAGNTSARAPTSSCAWIRLIVPVSMVSNGCGGGDWDELVWAQNYFGNRHTFFDAGSGLSYPVDFKRACDLHDAGYGGHAVADTINGGPPVDFRDWTRGQVDEKFLQDLRKLCEQAIPASKRGALKRCRQGAAWYAVGVNHLIGAGTLYGFVNRWGYKFYDFDLTTPGTQPRAEKKGTRDTFDLGKLALR